MYLSSLLRPVHSTRQTLDFSMWQTSFRCHQNNSSGKLATIEASEIEVSASNITVVQYKRNLFARKQQW
jgi:hypothetical protein